MRMDWNDCTMEAFNKASEYTRFHELVAEKLKSYVDSTSTLCDMGCGLALVDIYLSKYVKNITCVDVNEKVIDYAKKNAEKKKGKTYIRENTAGLELPRVNASFAESQ